MFCWLSAPFLFSHDHHGAPALVAKELSLLHLWRHRYTWYTTTWRSHRHHRLRRWNPGQRGNKRTRLDKRQRGCAPVIVRAGLIVRFGFGPQRQVVSDHVYDHHGKGPRIPHSRGADGTCGGDAAQAAVTPTQTNAATSSTRSAGAGSAIIAERRVGRKQCTCWWEDLFKDRTEAHHRFDRARRVDLLAEVAW